MTGAKEADLEIPGEIKKPRLQDPQGSGQAELGLDP